MRKIKPKFIYNNNKKKKAVLIKISDFDFFIEELEDYSDYKIIKERHKNTFEEYETFTPEEVMAELLGKR